MKILRTVFNALLLLVLAVFLSLNVIKINPIIAGYQKALTIRGGSMEPTIITGDLILIEETDPREIRTGDIVTVERPEGVYTHRVVDVREFRGEVFLQTKGDANEEPDPGVVPADMVVGKVCRVLPVHYMYSTKGFILLVVSPVVVLLSSTSWRLYLESKRRNRRKLLMYRKNSHQVLGASGLLLFLIFSMSCVNFIAPFVTGWSFTDFNDLEESRGTLHSGNWLNIKHSVIDIDPDTLNMKSKGTPITCYIELDESSDLYMINAFTSEIEALNGTVLSEPILADSYPMEYDDYDSDGVPDLKVQFNRTKTIEILSDLGYESRDKVKFRISGWLINGDVFKGSDIISLVEHNG